MFDLTTIQLRNEMIGSNLGVLDGPRIGLRKACCPRVVRRASILFMETFNGEADPETLDCLLRPGFTMGEFDAHHAELNAPKVCDHCGKEFTISTSRIENDTFTCSQECRDKWVPF